MRVVRHAVAEDFGVDPRAASDCPVVLLENHHRRAFAHHESVAVAVERTRRSCRIVVARRHRLDDRERAKAQRSERSFGAACNHHVGVSVTNLTERVADRDRARRAAHRVGGVRAVHAELDCDVAARRAAENCEREQRIDAANSALEKRSELRLSVGHAAERACPSSCRCARDPRRRDRFLNPRAPSARTTEKCPNGRGASLSCARGDRRERSRSPQRRCGCGTASDRIA